MNSTAGKADTGLPAAAVAGRVLVCAPRRTGCRRRPGRPPSGPGDATTRDLPERCVPATRRFLAHGSAAERCCGPATSVQVDAIGKLVLCRVEAHEVSSSPSATGAQWSVLSRSGRASRREVTQCVCPLRARDVDPYRGEALTTAPGGRSWARFRARAKRWRMSSAKPSIQHPPNTRLQADGGDRAGSGFSGLSPRRGWFRPRRRAARR